MKALINSLGILLSSIGAFLVWRYLTELSFVDHELFLKGHAVISFPEVTPEVQKKFRTQLLLSKTGLALIFIGGILQIISNYMPE